MAHLDQLYLKQPQLKIYLKTILLYIFKILGQNIQITHLQHYDKQVVSSRESLTLLVT